MALDKPQTTLEDLRSSLLSQAGPTGCILLRLGGYSGFIETSVEEVTRWLNEYSKRVMVIEAGLDSPTDLDRFVFLVLRSMAMLD